MRSQTSPLHRRDRTDGGSRRCPARPRRRGHSLLDVQVAFVILGIGLAGLSQVVVMQIRQVRVLENRLQGQVMRTNTSTPMLPGQTYYLVPWKNPWTRKLSGAAQIVASSSIPGDPVVSLSGSATPAYTINIQSLDASDKGQVVTATVELDSP
jgi:hypothetical protein